LRDDVPARYPDNGRHDSTNRRRYGVLVTQELLDRAGDELGVGCDLLLVVRAASIPFPAESRRSEPWPPAWSAPSPPWLAPPAWA
jgi:hypothetical protein